MNVSDYGDELQDQFPASYRVPDDDLRAPLIPEIDLIAKELDLGRIQKIIHLLWLSGRPVPPRPLHYQLALGRRITITERIEIHLVWGSGRIFLKPIPRYLLNPTFWETHLWCDQCQGQDFPAPPTSVTAQTCEHRDLRAVALGFLLSYVALIAYESDFAIAKDEHLIPAEITWSRWRQFVREVLAGGSAVQLYKSVAPRFVYGELRLNRLNLIFFAIEGPLSSGFVPTWNTFGSFFRDNSAWVITVTAYVILVLSAMEVGLSTDKLDNSEAFQTGTWCLPLGFSARVREAMIYSSLSFRVTIKLMSISCGNLAKMSIAVSWLFIWFLIILFRHSCRNS